MLEPFVSNEQWDLLQTELKLQISFQASKSYGELPNSAVHADLFRDNVLFDGEQLGGMIDFYFAGDDTWMFDLAVTCNDWCTESASGAWDRPRLHALLDAYCRTRTPLEAELEAWPFALRAAAFRFWVSRLFDLYLPREASLLTPKDPSQFERVLIARHGDHQLASLRESIARVDQASTTAAS